MRAAAALFVALATGCRSAPSSAPTDLVEPRCEPVRGVWPEAQPGTAELRAVLEVPPGLIDHTVYFALDYSTQERRRASTAVGHVEAARRETRFRCIAPVPRDVAFLKWVAIAEPQGACGYVEEVRGHHETRVVLECEPARVGAWENYRALFYGEEEPEEAEEPGEEPDFERDTEYAPEDADVDSVLDE